MNFLEKENKKMIVKIRDSDRRKRERERGREGERHI